MKQPCPHDEGCEYCSRLHDDCDGNEEYQQREEERNDGMERTS